MLKATSTCFCVARTRVVDCSAVSCTFSAGPVVTVKSFGSLIRRDEPILAPVTAKESSYCMSTFCKKAFEFFHRRTASLVIMFIVSSWLGIFQNPYAKTRADQAPIRSLQGLQAPACRTPIIEDGDSYTSQ